MYLILCSRFSLNLVCWCFFSLKWQNESTVTTLHFVKCPQDGANSYIMLNSQNVFIYQLCFLTVMSVTCTCHLSNEITECFQWNRVHGFVALLLFYIISWFLLFFLFFFPFIFFLIPSLFFTVRLLSSYDIHVYVCAFTKQLMKR